MPETVEQNPPDTTSSNGIEGRHPSISRIRLYPLASSSKANATAIVAGETLIVVDAGLSRSETIIRLLDLGLLSSQKTAPDVLLLTHEHGDHAKYAHQWLQHTAVIYCTGGTALKLGFGPEPNWRIAHAWNPITLTPGVVATCIEVPHDAAEPVAWRVAYQGEAVVVATDLGSFPRGFDQFCAGAVEILLEANYHRELLWACDYAGGLKNRIASDTGHLDIEDACGWLRNGAPDSLRRVVLGHISTKCAAPEIVRFLARKALDGKPIELEVLDK